MVSDVFFIEISKLKMSDDELLALQGKNIAEIETTVINKGLNLEVEGAVVSTVDSAKGSEVWKAGSKESELVKALPAARTTTHTLEQIKKMRGKQKWEAGETYVQEVYGSPGQRHYNVPKEHEITGTGGRYVDAPVDVAKGGVYANEVKTYQRYITVNRSSQLNKVPLSEKIKQQVLKDVWLRDNVQGYDPRWIFLDAPPSTELSNFLKEKNIISIIYE